MRRHISSPRASMITEYQASFLPPSCYKSVTSTSTQRNPYHPLKGTRAGISTIQKLYVIQNWIKPPPKVSKLSKPPEDHISAPTNMNYTTVYRNDFRAWKAEKRQAFTLKDNLKVNRGFTIADDAFKEHLKYISGNKKSVQKNQEKKPFEGISSYRLDYIPHQVQPRQSKRTPAYQTNKELPAVSSRPKSTCHQNQELLNGDFLDQFESWSLDTKLQSNAPAGHKFQSTTHADIAAPKCQVAKSVPSMQTSEKMMEPFRLMVNRKDCCRAWDGPQSFSRS